MKLHHQTYITNYNKALDQLDAAISKSDSIAKLHTALRFNGGGHINHSIFYLRFRKEEVKGSFGGAIDAQFGSLVALVGLLYRVLDGCGLVWTELKRLVVETIANQDPLVSIGANLTPLLGIDVWEHAYYLQMARAYLGKRRRREYGGSFCLR